jgi:ABC-type glycerol-3-phosphate transport system substrate-binding protein
MKMIRTMAAVAAVASVLSACGGGGTSDVGKELGLTNPEIHFIHAIPGGPAVDFLVNGTAPSGQTNVSYKGVTNFTNINTGSTTVAYSATGTTAALASGSFPDVAKGHEYTVLALPGLAAPDIGLIDDPFDKGPMRLISICIWFRQPALTSPASARRWRVCRSRMRCRQAARIRSTYPVANMC